jgi:hypothetical protein
VSTLGDENADVRKHACQALGNIGEKAAANEVISKLVILLNRDDAFGSYQVADTIENILNSPGLITQLSPDIVSELCQSERGLRSLRNVSVDHLIKCFFTDTNASWLPAVTRVALFLGAAVTVTEEKVAVFGRKESVELSVPTLTLREQLIEAFSVQAKRLHLSF